MRENLTENISEDYWINGHSKTQAVCDLLSNGPAMFCFSYEYVTKQNIAGSLDRPKLKTNLSLQ